MDGWEKPTTRHYKGKGLCVNSVLDWQYQDTGAYGTGSQRFSSPQSNNQELDPDKGGVFYISVLCMSCRGEHILNLFICTPYGPRFQL